jgi:hypothetical protein
MKTTHSIKDIHTQNNKNKPPRVTPWPSLWALMILWWLHWIKMDRPSLHYYDDQAPLLPGGPRVAGLRCIHLCPYPTIIAAIGKVIFPQPWWWHWGIRLSYSPSKTTGERSEREKRRVVGRGDIARMLRAFLIGPRPCGVEESKQNSCV